MPDESLGVRDTIKIEINKPIDVDEVQKQKEEEEAIQKAVDKLDKEKSDVKG